jgi:hypothetical protein
MNQETQKAILATVGRYVRRMFGEQEPRFKALEDAAAKMPEMVERAVSAAPLKYHEAIVRMVEVAVAALPAPAPGKSVTVDEVLTALLPRLSDRIDADVAKALLDIERRAQGVLERAVAAFPKPRDGKDGENGLDGFSLDDLTIDDDGDGGVTLRFVRGDLTRERVIRLPRVKDCGVFSEGDYRKGDGVTFGGSFWIAQIDAPQGKPGLSPDWRLAVKKGRDGSRA